MTKALTGEIQYYLHLMTFRQIERYYKRIGRGLEIQTLHMTDEQKVALLDMLDEQNLPENRDYDYRHLTANCCTRVRDLIDGATGGSLSAVNPGADQTYRDWIDRSLEPVPLHRIALAFLLGSPVDREISRWEEQFYPAVLADHLDRVVNSADGRPLVEARRIVVETREPEDKGTRYWTHITISVVSSALLLLALASSIAFPRKRPAARLLGLGLFMWGILAGVGGSALVFLWGMTDHTPTHYNENLLLFPFTHLWLVVPGLALALRATLGARIRRLLKVYLIAAIGLALIDFILKMGPFYQANLPFIAASIVLNTAPFLALSRIKRAAGF